MTSKPTPARRNVALNSGGGNDCLEPVPSNTTSGSCASIAAACGAASSSIAAMAGPGSIAELDTITAAWYAVSLILISPLPYDRMRLLDELESWWKRMSVRYASST